MPLCPVEYRCFLDQERLEPGRVELSEPESHHLARVRRAVPGTAVTLLNGRGWIADARVEEIGKRTVTLQVEAVTKTPPPTPAITLAIGGLKQAAWDELLRHCVELGVNQVLRVQTRHAVSEVAENRAESKYTRWRERLIQASKQAANPWLPELQTADSVTEALRKTPPHAQHILASLRQTGNAPLAECLRFSEGPLVFWVGPEGDFAEDEEVLLVEAGARPVSLGPRTLRAETAGLCLCAAARALAL